MLCTREQEAHAKITSLTNYLCNCDWNLTTKRICTIFFYVGTVFVDDSNLMNISSLQQLSAVGVLEKLEYIV